MSYLVSMTSHIDTLRTANLLIQQHGVRARSYAEAMMQHFMQEDDARGAATWLGIIADIEMLQNTAHRTLH